MHGRKGRLVTCTQATRKEHQNQQVRHQSSMPGCQNHGNIPQHTLSLQPANMQFGMSPASPAITRQATGLNYFLYTNLGLVGLLLTPAWSISLLRQRQVHPLLRATQNLGTKSLDLPLKVRVSHGFILVDVTSRELCEASLEGVEQLRHLRSRCLCFPFLNLELWESLNIRGERKGYG